MGDSSTDRIDLGEIGTVEIENVVSASSPSLDIKSLTEGYTVFVALRDGAENQWLYTGETGLVGQDDYIPDANDFQSLVISDSDSSGFDGLSAFEVWLANGNTGTEQDYLDSLVGPKGEDLTARTNKPVPESSYILLATDVDKFLIFSNACTVVVPNGLAANLEFQGKQGSTGQVVFSAESGGTLNVPSVFLAETAEQHCFFGIRTDGGDVSTILGTLKLL